MNALSIFAALAAVLVCTVILAGVWLTDDDEEDDE